MVVVVAHDGQVIAEKDQGIVHNGQVSNKDTKLLPLLQYESASSAQVEYGAEKRHKAWVEKDVEGSRECHRQMLGHSVPVASKAHLHRCGQSDSDYLRAIVFGGLDGIATIFATVAGCLGAQLTPLQILIVGFGNLLANAISMGFGEYLSSGAEEDFIENERAREEWEVDNCPEEEKREMVEIYQHRYGFSKEDASVVIDTAFKYKEFFISHMMAEELGLLLTPSEDSEGGSAVPATRGLVMFASFIVFGLVPLLSFLLIHVNFFQIFPLSTTFSFLVTGVLSCCALFGLGMLKSRFVSTQNPYLSGLGMMTNGTIAGLVAFGVGHTLQVLGGANVLD